MRVSVHTEDIPVSHLFLLLLIEYFIIPLRLIRGGLFYVAEVKGQAIVSSIAKGDGHMSSQIGLACHTPPHMIYVG